ILEVMAIKQLRCLRDELRQYGQEIEVTFRIEDETDKFLWPEESTEQSEAYTAGLRKLVEWGLDGTKVFPRTESSLIGSAESVFMQQAKVNAGVMLSYLRGEVSLDALHELGWKGNIPQEQREHYRSALKAYWDDYQFPVMVDPDYRLARYF